MKIKENTVEVLRDQTDDESGNKASVPNVATNSDNRMVHSEDQSGYSNLQTLVEFKKTLIEEQKNGEDKIQQINEKIELTKKQIDEHRITLEDLRSQLKKINEVKDSEYTKFLEIKNNLLELRNKMKNLDEKTSNYSSSKTKKERIDMTNLSRTLDQIERDIQTKKLSKEEERRLVTRSKETATKLHALRLIHKKEDDYRNLNTQYEQLRSKINSIFNQKAEFGEKIGKIKEILDSLLNLREDLYEQRRGIVRDVRESTAKLEMVDTQLNAIEYRRTHHLGKSRRPRTMIERKDLKQDFLQERLKRNKENMERWNLLKNAALKKMSNGDKLTFEEMKLIYDDDGT